MSINPVKLPELCRERAEAYGALRKSSLTAIALDEAADALERLQRELQEARGHLRTVLYRYQGAWHPDSIFQQEYGHEIEAARAFATGEPT